MAYKKTPFRVLAGSLAWLPPSDLLKDEDCLDNQNFRPDQLGGIRSRQGASALGTAGSGPVRTAIKGLATRYQGSGTALYRAFSSVATGFDGEPLGWADFLKWLWVMNQSKQVKDDGTNNRNFAITAPSDTPVAADGTEYNKDLTTFDNSETFTVDPSGDNSFDGTEFKQGTHSLLIEITGDATYTVTRTGMSVDLSSLDSQTATDDDRHRIWIYASKFKKLDEIKLKVDVSSTGGTFENYYQTTLSRKWMKKQAGKGWHRFELRRSKKLDADGNPIDKLPYFERFGGDTARSWATVTAIQIIIDARAAVDVRFDLWDVYGSVAGQISGDNIEYYYTYVNASEHESNPSPVSTAVTIKNTAVALSNLVASADAQVTKKYIYRTGGTLTRVWRVDNTGVANATTTFTDTKSDDELTALGMEMEDDNDPPPSAAGLLGPYLGRLIAWRTSTNKNRFFWSKLNKPWAWPGAASNLSGNWADIGASDEEIVWATHRTNMIWFYKENSIWILVGDPDDVSGQVQVSRASYGLIGDKALCDAGEVDYFQYKEGIARFNGDTAVKISQKIDPIFKGQTVTLATGVTIAAIDATNRDRATLEFINDRLYFSYPSSGQTNPDTTLIYDITTDRWYRDSRGFTALYYEGQNGVLQGGRSDGAVWQLETGTDDAGGAIPVIYHSRYHDVGYPDLDKTFEDFTIDHNTGGATLTVAAYTDDGNTAVTLTPTTTISSSTRTRTVLQLDAGDGVVGRNIAIRITGNASSSPVILYDIVLNYYLEARQAKSFDTDEVALGNGKMAKVREFRLDLDNAATVNLTLLSDQPGFAMASRDTATVALSTTRRLEPVVIDGDPRGFLHRLKLSGTDFRLYSCQALVQVIGTWLIGSKNEFYLSDPLDFGTERVKLFKEIQIDCDLSGGTASYTVETDQPGGNLDTRASGTISVTSGEKSTKIRLPGTTKGRFFRLRITPSSAAEIAIFAIRVWLKTLGEPNASSWTWMELPVEPTQDAVWMTLPIPTDELTA